MWLEKLIDATKLLQKINKEASTTTENQVLNAKELEAHKIFHELYTIVGNCSVEVKQTFNTRRNVIRREEINSRIASLNTIETTTTTQETVKTEEKPKKVTAKKKTTKKAK